MEVAADGTQGKEEAALDSGKAPQVVAELLKWLEDDGDAWCDQEEVGEIEPAAVEELMKWLEESEEGEGYGGFSFIATSPSYSSSSVSLCLPTADSVTICGNEESCGSSFSGNASTVMASIDTRGSVSGVLPYFVGCPSDLAISWPCSASPIGPWTVGLAAGGISDSEKAALEVGGDSGGGDALTWKAVGVDEVALGV